jgi:hypothetical protein
VSRWLGWAVVLPNGDIRCAFADHEKEIAENEASRYGADAKVVQVEITRRRRAKKTRRVVR